MNPNEKTPPLDGAMKIVRGELSSSKRWMYRGLLIVTSIWVAALVAMWMTEPRELPLQLNVAFTGLTMIGFGWIGVLVWILTRRSCPTALDRIATGWMATVACSFSLVLSVAIALIRENGWAAAILAVLGLVLLGAAMLMLRSAYSMKARLLASLQALKKGTSAVIGLLIGLAMIGCVWTKCSADEKLKIERTTIETRGGGVVEAELGRLTVPLYHAQPDGPQIEIAYIRVAGNKDSDSSPLFVLAGGLGDSGIGVMRGMFGDGGAMLRKYIDGDVIGIDQRGVGESKPNLAVPDRYGFSIPAPGSPDEYSRRIAETHGQIAKRLSQSGIDLGAFNTNENSDDLNALRQALGYEKIRLWGTSYGSHLALSTIRRHEEHIERAFIASPEGPDHTLKHPAHVQNCLKRLAANDPELWPAFEKVLKKLKSAPIRASVIHPISKQPVEIGISDFDVRLWAWNSMDRIENVQQFVKAVRQMEAGEFSAPGLWLLRYRAMSGPGSAMKHAMDAASGGSRTRTELIEAESGSCLLGDVINYPGVIASSAWGVQPLPDDFRSQIQSACPLLIVCGDLDARTPLENAREILEGFPNGRLVVVEGGGHGFKPAPSLMEIVGDFFRGEKLPAEQTVKN